ncbi:MlaD family protein [Nocardia brasiliensis]
MKPGSAASLASIATILALGGSYLSFGVVKVDWLRDTVTATMTMPASGGLLPRSKVLLSGVEVGRVVSVTHVDRDVRVDFRVDGKYRIPVSSVVRVESLSGLGEPYLDFRPADGAGPYLVDGQTVRADKIVAPLSIPDVADKTTELLRQVDPAALAAIVDTFGQALAGTDAVVPTLSRATDLLAATLLSRTDALRRTLLAMQANADDMAWSGPALSNAAQPWADFGPRVADVAESIARIIRVGNTPDDYLDDNADTIGLVPFLRELAERIDDLGPELAPLLPLVKPLIAAGTTTLGTLDLGALITQALHTTDPDGAVRLQITVK